MDKSQRLATVRKFLGFTQREFAQELGFQTNYIGKLECSAQKVSQQFLNRLCLVFPQVNRLYIETGEGEPLHPEKPETPEERREKLIKTIIDLLALLDDPARQIILESIQRYKKEQETAKKNHQPDSPLIPSDSEIARKVG